MLPNPAPITWLGRMVLATNLLLAPLIFWRATTDVFEANKVALLLLTAIVLSALYLTHRLAASAVPRRTAFDLMTVGIWLSLASATVSTMLSLSPLTSFWGAVESNAGLITIIGYAVIYFATRFFFRDAGDYRRLLAASVLSAAFASAYAIVQASGGDVFDWSDRSSVDGYHRPFGTLGHPSLLAAFLVMVIPLTVEFSRRAMACKRWLTLAGAVTTLVLAAIAVGLTLSRAAWLGLAAVVLIMAGGWLVARRSRAALTLGVAGVIAVVALGIVAGVSSDSLTRLFHRIGQIGDAGSRSHLWKAGWEMFVDRPWTGVGLDAYQLAFAGKRTPEYWSIEWNATPARAHNEVIHILATQGILGLLGTGLFALGLVWKLIQGWRRCDVSERPLLVAVAASVTGFFVQMLVGFTVVGTGTLMMTLAAYVAICDSRRATHPIVPTAEIKRRFALRFSTITIVWMAAAGLVFHIVVQPTRARLASAKAERVSSYDLNEAIVYHEHAVMLDPTRAEHWTKLGVAKQTVAQATPDGERRRELLQQAHHAFEQAKQMVPVSGFHQANLGRVLCAMAREQLVTPDGVFAAFDRAIEMDPNNAYFYADAANVGLVLGRLDQATWYASMGLERYPYFAPLRVVAGYVAMQQDRLHDASLLIAEAISLEWRGDATGHRVANAALNHVYAQITARESRRVSSSRDSRATNDLHP